MRRTQVINDLIKQRGYTSYLEIGLGDGTNFRNVVCNGKVGTDPNQINEKSDLGWLILPYESDEYFIRTYGKFDLIFIDGLHHADQVERDIINSWNCLNKGGTILIHDIKPLDEVCQRVPRETVSWTGDVWRAWYGLAKNYPKLKLSYIDERVGLGMIEKTNHKIKAGFIDYQTTYQEYDRAQGWLIK